MVHYDYIAGVLLNTSTAQHKLSHHIFQLNTLIAEYLFTLCKGGNFDSRNFRPWNCGRVYVVVHMWASPTVLVAILNCSTWVCIDYQHLNVTTKIDEYPLLRVDECLNLLSGHRYFSTLDLPTGYWQVKLAEKVQEMTALTYNSQWTIWIHCYVCHLVYAMRLQYFKG